ncbi:MAG: Asp-tRNA(Asn)/Glu-tRNA(Gln) amidotransferase subunit GatA [Firmicutes bacterium]|uniref:Asp-tRNA(Asn)/Glu-tRNA(Gln) amidotransferase subunit GatA n=1 Tax=Candidatus Onthovivens merdipullorum TaxID=2840889 RepID=A0A9D9DHT9_9BACL|nr:Asp-tRNA(Asn)/Glu-tRNA(Gln) amidotransferase subunit GatA [Candidatus Onthovivens merdipullorum]
MNYLDLTIKDIHSALANKEVKVSDLLKEALSRAKENKDNAFETILEIEALKKAYELDKLEVPKDNYLFGIPFVAKDNFSTKDIETTGSSNILNGYIPLFNATVINKLYEKNAILIGKTTLDELAMGGTGTSGHKGTTFNPYDKTHTHLIGGSSSGSAVSVSDAITPFALGSDTGDSVRKPASNAGLVGFKPTWGRISRFGLFPFAPSLDHVAYFTRSSFDAAILLEALAGRDEHDSTSSPKEVEKYTDFIDHIKGKKFAVIKEIKESITDEVLNKKFAELVEKIKNKGGIVNEVSIDINLLNAIFPAYFVISCAEATSNNANLDGIKFGPNYGGKTYQEVMFNARTKGFSNLIKRRFVIGSYALMKENQEELFLRAQKARRLIVNAFNDILDKYDFIINLASPSVAPKIGAISDKLSNTYLIADNYLAYANFGGQPSITLPLGFKENLPFGVNVTSKIFTEKKLLSVTSELEDLIGLKNLSIRTYKKEEK